MKESSRDHLGPTKSRRIKIRILKTAALLIVILALGMGSFIWRAGGELACPPRLAITEAGQTILNAPEKHGVTIRSGLALDDRVPYLIVEPSLGEKPSERGVTLRKQLTAEGIILGQYGAINGTVVLLHGRMARKENFLAVAVRFCAAGFRCIIPDLPAHGESPIDNVAFGSSEFESTIPENLHRELLSKQLIGDEPACLWGMSMGGAFATSAASRNPDYWRSLIVVSSFDNLETLVTEKSARYAGPAAPALAYLVEKCAIYRGGVPLKSVQPYQWARAVTTPTLVFHGDVDDLISIERGHALYDAFASSHKAWIPVSDGGHGNVLITPAPTYRMMAEWMIDPTIHRESLPRTSNPPSTALFQDSPDTAMD